MESKYNYFKRDISWLSFNYRVLLEALDERLPLYERINFISIYSSNLEEFYKIRVADHKAVASGATESDEETVQSARELVEEINKEREEENMGNFGQVLVDYIHESVAKGERKRRKKTEKENGEKRR